MGGIFVRTFMQNLRTNCMNIFALEHSKVAHRADFALYGVASVALAVFLAIAGPQEQRLEILTLAVIGLASWTVTEYALHRFVLHGVHPFSTWHEEHHRRPTALISTPTLLSAALIMFLVFLPVLILGGLWHACAFTLGVMTGYFVYSITHHAIHHWHVDNDWLRRRKRWHAWHHRPGKRLGHYGVTSSFWDHVFSSKDG
jgi:sterol desaturase/sphingolipid hydroxylase (fatty acid hydroxylase superfamily)